MFSPWAEICSHQFCFEYVCVRNKLIKNVYVPKFHEETLANFLLQTICPALVIRMNKKEQKFSQVFLSLVLPYS